MREGNRSEITNKNRQQLRLDHRTYHDAALHAPRDHAHNFKTLRCPVTTSKNDIVAGKNSKLIVNKIICFASKLFERCGIVTNPFR